MVAVLPEHQPDSPEAPSQSDGAFAAAAERDPGDYTLHAGIKIMSDDLYRTSYYGTDHYDGQNDKSADKLVTIAGGAAAGLTQLGNVLLVRYGLDTAPAQSLGLDVGHVAINAMVDLAGLAALTGRHHEIGHNERWKHGHALRAASFNGHSIEAVCVSQPHKNVRRGLLATVIPHTERDEYAVYPPGELTLEQIMELARRTRATGVLVPYRLAGDDYAADFEPPEPLTDWMRGLKGFGVNLRAGAEDEPYVCLPVTPKDEKQDDLLEERLYALHDALVATLPDAGLEDADLWSSEGLRDLARRLHTVVHMHAADAMTPRGVHPALAHVYLAKRFQHYVMPEPAEDDFSPAVSVHYVSPGVALPPERYTIAQLAAMRRPGGGQVDTSAGMNENDILPAVAELLAGLKEREEAVGEQSDRSQIPKLLRDVQVSVVPRAMKVMPRGENEPRNERIRRKLRRGSQYAAMIVGATALAVSAWARVDVSLSGDDAMMSSPGTFESGTGSGDLANMPIRWQLEDHGLGVAGRYKETIAYEYSGQTWRGEVGNAMRLHLDQQPYDPATTPHVTVRDILQIGDGATRLLAIKEGTRIAASRVQTPAGDEIEHGIFLTDDGMAFIAIEEETEGPVEISYDLAATKMERGAIRNMVIEGVQPVGILTQDSTGEMSRFGTEVQRGFSYDNTEALDEAIAGKDASGIHDELMEKKIANCSATGLVVAVNHERADGNDHLGMAGGFLVDAGDKYLRKLHVWLEDRTGRDHDYTPFVRGRSPEEAGVPPDDPAKLDAEWQKRAVRFDDARPVHIPWREMGLGVLAAGLAVGSAGPLGRLRYTMLNARHWLAGRHISGAQADALISHHVYGDARELPVLRYSTERLSEDATPTSVVAKFAADARRMAPHLGRLQQRSLQRQARLILDSRQ